MFGVPVKSSEGALVTNNIIIWKAVREREVERLDLKANGRLSFTYKQALIS